MQSIYRLPFLLIHLIKSTFIPLHFSTVIAFPVCVCVCEIGRKRVTSHLLKYNRFRTRFSFFLLLLLLVLVLPPPPHTSEYGPAINNGISCALFVHEGRRFPDSSGEPFFCWVFFPPFFLVVVDESQVWETPCGERRPGARALFRARVVNQRHDVEIWLVFYRF